jgi:tRNA threonylcarbamoyladenosine biosynthesis protein TsaB
MRTLIIEVSTERCSLIIGDTQTRFIEKQLPIGYQQSKLIMPTLINLINESSINIKDLDCIGIGVGPGSYTGIRIGATVAKTLSYASQIPLVTFCSLCAFIPDQNGTFAALIDAKIGGVYIIKGVRNGNEIIYTTSPTATPLEKLLEPLSDVTQLITPNKQRLEEKLNLLYPNSLWQWQESPPNMSHLIQLTKNKFDNSEITDHKNLELLYLRKTQAEISRELG